VAVTDWRLRRWRLWFLALSNAPRDFHSNVDSVGKAECVEASKFACIFKAAVLRESPVGKF